jgi:hypothetical protein
VEPKLTAARVEEYRQQVETAMNRMYQELWQEVGRDGHV